MKKLYTVGELAKEMNVTVRTLQYYDKINLLKPSSYSEGGRRLYSNKDMLKLHQILSLKYLGFSLDDIVSRILPLDTPEEILKIMHNQIAMLKKQVLDYQAAIATMEKLEREIQKIGKVDFQKYADIISLLQNDNKNYWIVNCFDDQIMDHLRTQFKDDPEGGNALYREYQSLVDEAMHLQEQHVPADSKQALDLGKRWWDMVMNFTKGDMSLLSGLQEFNDDRKNWDHKVAQKQEAINSYIEKILEAYFASINMVPEGLKL